jgi:hypothetical protein
MILMLNWKMRGVEDGQDWYDEREWMVYVKERGFFDVCLSAAPE